MHEFSYCAFVQLNLTTDHLAVMIILALETSTTLGIPLAL